MHNNILIISLDALSSSDFNKIRETYAFREILKRGRVCSNVKSVYPSLTYPAHATIMTGKTPRNHGIINNTKIQPNKNLNPDWYWFRRDIHGETLYDIAHKRKKDVASFLWPTTGSSSIKYNLPEIFPVKKSQNQVARVLRAGSALFCLELNKKFSHLRQGISQPYLDDFVHASSMYTFEKYNPYMTLIHYCELDYMRHHHGYSSLEADRAVISLSRRISDWVDFLKRINRFEETLFVITGDHSHKTVSKVIRPNVFLEKLGLIETKDKEIKSYKAYFKSADGSGYIYLKNKKDEKSKKLLEENLTVLTAYEKNGIERFLSGEKAALLGADGTCTFMIEASDGYYFREDLNGEFIESVSDRNGLKDGDVFSAHGYDPEDKDYRTVFLISGPDVKVGDDIKEMNLTDIAPTIAKLMDSTLTGVDGKVRYEFIR